MFRCLFIGSLLLLAGCTTTQHTPVPPVKLPPKDTVVVKPPVPKPPKDTTHKDTVVVKPPEKDTLPKPPVKDTVPVKPPKDTVKAPPIPDTIVVVLPTPKPPKDTIPKDTIVVSPADTCACVCEDTAVVVPAPPKDTAKPLPPAVPKFLLGMLPYTKATTMGLPLGRNKIVVSTGDGVNVIHDTKGVQFIPSIVWILKEFPADLSLYKKKLQAIADQLTKDKCPSVVIENEPNFNEVNGDVNTYVQMCKIATDIFTPKGIDVFSGGLTYPALASYCYQLYIQEGDTKSAQVFKKYGMASANKESLDWVTQYLQKVTAENIPVNFNFHVNIDTNTLAVLPWVVRKVRAIVKGKVIVGECSFSTTDEALVTFALATMKSLYGVILYSEEKGKALAVPFTKAMDDAAKVFNK